jgi:hypothetical protein
MHRADGRLHIPEGGEDDRGRHIAGIAQPLEKGKAIHAGHVEIGKDHIGREII